MHLSSIPSLWLGLGIGLAVLAAPFPSGAGLGEASAQTHARVQATPPSADYIRIVDENDGLRVGLETSARVFKPASGSGASVVLVGVMHVGDRSYYDALQKFLDAQDLVLFEGVKPSGAGEAAQAAPDDPAKAKLTERRLRLLATMIEKQRVEWGRYPASLGALKEAQRRPVARIAEGAMVDGWGRPVVYTMQAAAGGEKAAFELASLGADGAEGGEGAAADLKFSDQPALTKAEIGEKQEGIQTQLAGALGLEFQLMAIDYDRPNWRNSDMSIDQVQVKLKEAGAGGEALFRMLDGSSLSAKLAGLVLGIVRANPTSQAMAKLMMVEALGHADELLGSVAGAGKLMKVIVTDRNEAVFRDLQKVLAEEPGFRSVSLFYGAGHLPDMERRLTKDMGYTFVEDRWFRAIDMDLKESGLDPAQARKLRETMSQAIRAQIKRPKGKPERADPAAPASEN